MLKVKLPYDWTISSSFSVDALPSNFDEKNKQSEVPQVLTPLTFTHIPPSVSTHFFPSCSYK